MEEAIEECAGYGGIKDPVVSRVVALETEPPQPVLEMWEKLRPFVENPY